MVDWASAPRKQRGAARGAAQRGAVRRRGTAGEVAWTGGCSERKLARAEALDGQTVLTSLASQGRVPLRPHVHYANHASFKYLVPPHTLLRSSAP